MITPREALAIVSEWHYVQWDMNKGDEEITDELDEEMEEVRAFFSHHFPEVDEPLDVKLETWDDLMEQLGGPDTIIILGGD